MNSVKSSSPRLPRRRARSITARRDHAGFSLTELLVAMSILGMAMAMTGVVFIAALKRAQHTENMLKGTAELRYATDIISQAIRSSPQLPKISSDGLSLYVFPKDLGYLVVDETTFIDTTKNIKGTKSNQRNMKVDPVMPAVVTSAFLTTSRPSGSIALGHVSDYFVTANTTTTPKVSSLLAVNDQVTIPATYYGNATTLTVNSVSNNSGTATITYTTNVGVNVPQGTKITISSGRQLLFRIVTVGTSPATTELRYYADDRNLTTYSVLARDIATAPLSDPSSTSSTPTVPFAFSGTSTSTVTLNLQKIPAGTSVGRTLQGVMTTVYTRTDPTIQ